MPNPDNTFASCLFLQCQFIFFTCCMLRSFKLSGQHQQNVGTLSVTLILSHVLDLIIFLRQSKWSCTSGNFWNCLDLVNGVLCFIVRGVENVQYATNQKRKGCMCDLQCKVCLIPRARSLPRNLIAASRLRRRSAIGSKTLWQARGPPTVYCQAEWLEYRSCLRYRLSVDFLVV